MVSLFYWGLGFGVFSCRFRLMFGSCSFLSRFPSHAKVPFFLFSLKMFPSRFFLSVFPLSFLLPPFPLPSLLPAAKGRNYPYNSPAAAASPHPAVDTVVIIAAATVVASSSTTSSFIHIPLSATVASKEEQQLPLSKLTLELEVKQAPAAPALQILHFSAS